MMKEAKKKKREKLGEGEIIYASSSLFFSFFLFHLFTTNYTTYMLFFLSYRLKIMCMAFVIVLLCESREKEIVCIRTIDRGQVGSELLQTKGRL